MNPFSIESWFGSNNINKRHNKRVMGKMLGGREAHYSRAGGGCGDTERSSPGGRKDRVVPGVATLDRGPDQSPVG